MERTFFSLEAYQRVHNLLMIRVPSETLCQGAVSDCTPNFATILCGSIGSGNPLQ
jgi:hypothetical protein